jgi:membrane protein
MCSHTLRHDSRERRTHIMATLSSERLESAARKEASWVVRACRQFVAHRCPSLAASIAFYSAFSLAPTLVMVIAVAGWFFGADAARGELFRQVHNVLGNDAAAGITTIVQNAHRAGGAGGVATAISLALLAIGASATFSSLNAALDVVWPPEGPRTSSVLALVRVRLISFSLVLGVAFLLIVSLVLDAAITFVGQWLWGESTYVIIGNIAQLAVGLLVLAIAFGALMRFLPDATVRWRDAMVGGIVAAVLFSVGKKLFALYLAHAGMATAFGAAGSLAVLLMWLYFSAAVLLLGAEFAAARAHLHDPRGAWGFLDETPPGSRAKLASVLAASTIAPVREAAAGAQAARAVPIGNPGTGAADDRAAGNGVPPPYAAAAAGAGQARTEGGAFAPRDANGAPVRRAVVRMEDKATYAAAFTIAHAGRTVAAADRYIKRHPWRSVLLVASAALAMTTAAGRRHAGAHDERNET